MTPRGGTVPRYRPGTDARPTPRETFEIAVGSVLAQNTAWTNAARAVSSLARDGLLDPRRLERLPHRRLAATIRSAGYFRLKARRIASLVASWNASGGHRGLARRTTEELRTTLRAVKGVGPETGESILAYGFRRDAFVVDAYARRILERHGLAAPNEPYDAIRVRVEGATSGPRRGRRLRELHAHLVEVGKRWCRPREARCEMCPLREIPFA